MIVLSDFISGSGLPDLPHPVGPVTSTGRPSHSASATARRLRAVDSTATSGSDAGGTEDEDEEEEKERLLGTRMPPMSIINSFRSASLMHTLLPPPTMEDDEDEDEDEEDEDEEDDEGDKEDDGAGASVNEAASIATARLACSSCASMDSRYAMRSAKERKRERADFKTKT